MTSRRSFLAGIAALLSAPVVAAIPVTASVPGPRRWLWVHGSDWRPMMDSLDRCMNLTACRSDGQYFYVIARQRLEYLEGSPEVVCRRAELEIANAHATLDSFLNCDCIAGNACPRHYVRPWTPEEKAEYELSQLQS